MSFARLIAGLAALLIAVQVVRSAAVQALAQSDPGAAAGFWPRQPVVQINRGLVGIAEATRDGRPVGADLFAPVRAAATRAPLEPEPFLVRGVQAQLAGQNALAERAFLAAQRRDPRSLPAAYFLASHYVQSGNADKGLVQIATLARLAPGGVKSVAPYIATYARDRANWARLRTLFRAEPELREASLQLLATDPSNAQVVLGITEAAWRSPDRQWVKVLLRSLVDSGQHARARAIWAQVSRVKPQPDVLIHDSGFVDATSPPPFNWRLELSKLGVAERKPGGRLHVMFYGQTDGVLASQLLLLPPGRYRMGHRLTGSPEQARALSWTLRCDDRPSRLLGQATLDRVAANGWSFEVPAGCSAQWLELRGTSAEIPKQSEVTISGLTLVRGGGGA